MRVGVIIAAALLVSGAALADQAKEPATRTGKQPAKAKANDKQAEAPPVVEEPAEPPAEPAPEESEVPHIKGPKLVDLGNDIEIDLADGFALLEREQAQEMLRKSGDGGEDVLAMVMKPGSDWAVIIEYSDVGYVDDDDADELNAGELLESYREGTAQQNIKRKELGVAELFIDGWSEMPRYEPGKHHLVWGLNAHDTDGKVVNYFTRILGRRGFISINLIASPEILEQARAEAQPVLDATRYRLGARYEDHQEGDKMSGLGLTALVLGGAGVAKAAKVGIFVAILAFLKKGFVLILLPFAALGKWLFGRKKTAAPAPDDPDANAT
jgi:uncharacterized membrane-anchored protein